MLVQVQSWAQKTKMKRFIGSLFKKKEEVNYKELLKQGAIIVDVRSKEEFDAGHIKSSVNIPLDAIDSSLKKLGSKDTHIILCCASGMRSGLAKNILHKIGYTNVHNGGNWASLNTKV